MSEGQRFAGAVTLITALTLVVIIGGGALVGALTGLGFRLGSAAVALGISVLVNIANIVISVMEE